MNFFDKGSKCTTPIIHFYFRFCWLKSLKNAPGLLQTKLDKTLAANPKNKFSRFFFIFLDMHQGVYMLHISVIYPIVLKNSQFEVA